MTQSFRELHVWRRSMEMTAAVYHLTRAFPKDELYGLTSQIRRSAVLVPSNIAEGQGRSSNSEFRQFLNIARGSNCEVQTQLEIARMLGFGESDLIEQAECLSHEVGKMLHSLMESLRDQSRSH